MSITFTINDSHIQPSPAALRFAQHTMDQTTIHYLHTDHRYTIVVVKVGQIVWKVLICGFGLHRIVLHDELWQCWQTIRNSQTYASTYQRSNIKYIYILRSSRMYERKIFNKPSLYIFHCVVQRLSVLKIQIFWVVYSFYTNQMC